LNAHKNKSDCIYYLYIKIASDSDISSI